MTIYFWLGLLCGISGGFAIAASIFHDRAFSRALRLAEKEVQLNKVTQKLNNMQTEATAIIDAGDLINLDLRMLPSGSTVPPSLATYYMGVAAHKILRAAETKEKT